jgi:PPOX class probable F420-dependent enzyme
VTLQDLPSWARELIESERVARLAFLDAEDRPRVLPVTFAVTGDAVWSAIDEKPKRRPEPARVRYLRRRPEAALCVDVYEDDWSRLAWVQLLGRVAVLSLEDGGEGLDELAAKYAPYRERRPPGPLLRLEVERALYWRAAGGGAQPDRRSGEHRTTG